MSPLASRGLGIAPAEPGLLPQAQRSSKATNRERAGTGTEGGGEEPLAPGLGEPETNLGQGKSGLQQ